MIKNVRLLLKHDSLLVIWSLLLLHVSLKHLLLEIVPIHVVVVHHLILELLLLVLELTLKLLIVPLIVVVLQLLLAHIISVWSLHILERAKCNTIIVLVNSELVFVLLVLLPRHL